MKIEFDPCPLPVPSFEAMRVGQWFRWDTRLCFKVNNVTVFTLDKTGGALESYIPTLRSDIEMLDHTKMTVVVHP